MNYVDGSFNESLCEREGGLHDCKYRLSVVDYWCNYIRKPIQRGICLSRFIILTFLLQQIVLIISINYVVINKMDHFGNMKRATAFNIHQQGKF